MLEGFYMHKAINSRAPCKGQTHYQSLTVFSKHYVVESTYYVSISAAKITKPNKEDYVALVLGEGLIIMGFSTRCNAIASVTNLTLPFTNIYRVCQVIEKER